MRRNSIEVVVQALVVIGEPVLEGGSERHPDEG
jgi:hypothetical protein